MAEQGKKSEEQHKKRPRLSEKAEGSGAKKSRAVAVTTVSPAELAALNPIVPRIAPLSSPSPVAKAKPITTVGVTTPPAVMPPARALPAPSPVATKSRMLTELNLVPITKSAAKVAMTSPVAAMPQALAAPSPAATRVLAAPSPVATETQTPVSVAIAKPSAGVKAGGDGAGQAGGAMVAAAAQGEGGELVNVGLPKKRLHCAVCIAALKPPVFKCESEHAVCCACADGGGANKYCGRCGRAVTYTHSRYIDDLVDDYKVPCPYKQHGCSSFIAYHAAADHRSRCAHAPCYCFECSPPFEGSPASLMRHLTGKHSWPGATINYEVPYRFVVPESSKDDRRLLVAEEDGSVFLLSVGAGRGPAGRRPVTVVCVRGNTASNVRPLYKCVLSVLAPRAYEGDLGGSFKLNGTVASCSVPGEVDMELGWLLAHVTHKMLHGESKEVHLGICISKFP